MQTSKAQKQVLIQFQLPEPDRLVDMAEAAKLLGMPVSTFWEKHIDLGLLPVILHPEFRSKYRWSANEIYSFIAARKKERDTKQEKLQQAMDTLLQKVR